MSKAATGKVDRVPWLYLFPALAVVGLFMYAPLLFLMVLSVSDWDLLSSNPDFVGAGNFRELATDQRFIQALGNTVLYLFGLLPVLIAGPLVAAALLQNLGRRATAFYRSVLFLPVVISFSIGSIIWVWILNPVAGPLVPVLSSLGMQSPNWFNDPRLAPWAICAIVVWRLFGQNMLFYLAGMAGMPRNLYDAARIEGASERQIFWRITIPLMRPYLLFVSIFTLMMASVYSFVPIHIITGGGPVGATTNVIYVIWQYTFDFLNTGLGAAVSLVVFALFVILAVAQWRLLGGRGGAHA